MKRKTIICFMAFAVLLLHSCKNKIAEKQEYPIVIEAYTVVMSSKPIQQHYTGIVEESFASMLSFQVAGNVQEIFVQENQVVQKGQLLANIDKSILKNSYDATKATLLQAEDVCQRMRTLYGNGSLPEMKWIEVQSALQQAKSMESIAKNNLYNGSLYAPFSGILAKRLVEAGTNVMSGVPVFKLVKTDKIKVKIAVPENEIATIQVGQLAQINVLALGKEAKFEAPISEKGSIANPLSHTYEVKINLDNAKNELMPGMVCEVSIESESKADKPQVVIPSHAVQVDNNNSNFVWLVKDGLASKQTITSESFSDSGIVISQGLKEGDMVIVKGNQKISEGMNVDVK